MNPYTPSVVTTPAPTKPRRRWIWPVVIAAVAVLLIAAGLIVWVGRAASSTVSITGSVQVTLPEDDIWPSPCTGMGGYSDIAAGTQVVISDETGTTIAVGRLQPGVAIGTPPVGHACRLRFSVNAPGGHSFYGIEISHRGRLQYPRAALDQPLALTLG